MFLYCNVPLRSNFIIIVFFRVGCCITLFSQLITKVTLLCIAGSQNKPATPSPRSASKKLTSPLRCLSLKKMEEPDDETEHLQQPGNDPYQDLENAYVAQVCLTWEALHSEYTQLSQKISCQPENPTCYNHSAQQFQVLLQRYIENEPFEQGLRAEIYARSRKSLPKLLQVPNIQGKFLLHNWVSSIGKIRVHPMSNRIQVKLLLCISVYQKRKETEKKEKWEKV